MTPLTLLDTVEIPSPCRIPWDTMAGDDRVRHCSHCSQSVYDVSAMSAEEAAC